ncbi:hypothetical protein ABT382_29960 [Streptomyces pharetrae]|uniref:hypothetical protein n=1 Tax=Streptomyces pharetrae TaxID=291370 RepID=UPI0033617B42
MVNSASSSPRRATATPYRAGIRAAGAAVCCGVLLSGPAIATAAAPAAPAAQVRTQADGKHEGCGRGTLVSAEKLYTLATPQAVAAAELGGAGFEGDTVRHGVVAYRLVYRTVDLQGEPTAAGETTGHPKRLAGPAWRLRACTS